MIEVRVLEATKDFRIQKNGTFLKGNKYFGRLSSDGNSYVARGEEGYWVVIENYKWAHNRYKARDLFGLNSVIYMRNRKRLNVFHSVDDYLMSGNMKSIYGAFIFEDGELRK